MVRADLIIAGVVREITITENGKQNVNTKIEVWPDARHRKGCGAQTQWLYICIYCRQTIQTIKTISLSNCNFFPFRHDKPDTALQHQSVFQTWYLYLKF